MAKGSLFERDLCRQLTAWWTGDPTADVAFWRTSQSGGRATTRRKSNKETTRAHCGDIAALDHVGKPFTDVVTVEAKRGYSKATVHELFDRVPDAAKQTYEEWIAQARAAAKSAGTPYWAIIHRRDRREILIAVPMRLVAALNLDPEPPCATCDVVIRVGERKIPANGNRRSITAVQRVRIRFLVMPFGAFLGSVTPDMIRGLGKSERA